MHKVFIIAEAGVNHNGSLELAMKMVDAAYEAGVDAIKFQTFKAEQLVSRFASLARYQIKSKLRVKNQSEMLKKLELSYEDFSKLKKYSDERNIIFLSTPFDYESVDFLMDLVPLYKIASGEITNIPLLQYIAKKNKPIILSTGMSTLEEVKSAVDAIRGVFFEPKDKRFSGLTLLHCTTNYPCDYKAVNLKAMITIKDTFNLAVGYSDHTLG
ncbi:MAG: N-acetylneuraminate synthase family protein, partial [bacterium]